MYMIKEMPFKERPRERFLTSNIESITDVELLAILLRTGTKQESVIELAKRVLYENENLKELSQKTVRELTKIKGIGNAKAIQILAGIELGKRVSKESFKKLTKLSSPQNVYDYLKTDFELKDQENFIAIYLNTKGELIGEKIIFVGSLNASLVHPRAIFKQAVLLSAALMIIAHNHPSGDPTPSKADIEFTKILNENSRMMDIELLDHIIIGKDRYFSFKKKNILK